MAVYFNTWCDGFSAWKKASELVYNGNKEFNYKVISRYCTFVDYVHLNSQRIGASPTTDGALKDLSTIKQRFAELCVTNSKRPPNYRVVDELFVFPLDFFR